MSIIIPVLNAEAFLESSLRTLRDYAVSCGYGVEIIVVDDGSSDRTLEIARSYAGSIRDYTILHLPENKGKGGALKEGFRKARGAFLVFTDADLPYGIAMFGHMFGQMRAQTDLSLLYGSRSHPASQSRKKYGFIRNAGRTFFKYVVQSVLLSGIPDTQCGIKMMRKEFAVLLLECSRVDRFAFDIEMFVIARKNSLLFLDFPVELIHHKESSVRLVADTLMMIWDIIHIRLRLGRGEYER